MITITPKNYRKFLQPIVDGEKKATGLKPRNYNKYPLGYSAAAPAFDLPLLPQDKWQQIMDAQRTAKARLSDIRNRGLRGRPIPSRDQNGRGYCVTEDTEVLTQNGWVPWPEYNWTDLLATVNPANGMMEYQAPFAKHVYEYDGPMIYSTNRRIDFGVTPDHRMLVRKWDERQRTLSDHFSFQRAGDLGWYVGLPHAPTGTLGVQLDEITIPGDRSYSGDDFIALVSLVLSDGYAGGSLSTKNWVSFCCFNRERYPKVAELARRVGFTEKPSEHGVFVRYSAGALAEWIRQNCYISAPHKAPNKRLPDIIRHVSSRQIQLFLDFFGDKNHFDNAPDVFYSASKQLIDDLQELYLRIGKRASIGQRGPRLAVMEDGKEIQSGPSYTLFVSDTDKLCLDRKKHLETDRYKGLVYCASVPNSTLITRRNGSVLLSGNCWGHSGTSANLLVRARDNQPYADLSAYAVCCIIKNYRDEGGWGLEGVEFQANRGIPTSEFWPQKSTQRSNDKPETWENAKLHTVEKWADMEPRHKGQLVTCLLCCIPVVVDFNWWSHSVCAMDLVSINPFKILIWNSWGDSWSENGAGELEGSRAIPDGQVCPMVVSAANKLLKFKKGTRAERRYHKLIGEVVEALTVKAA